MFSYFPDGFRHFLTALVFFAAYRRIAGARGEAGFAFWAGLVAGSSALFFLPNVRVGLPVLGALYPFLHFPLPDWDILLLGMDWHRSVFTHSLLAPVVVAFPLTLARPSRPAAAGLLVGAASHLVHDAVTASARTAIILAPGLPGFAGLPAYAWLVVNGILLFAVAVGFAATRPPDGGAGE